MLIISVYNNKKVWHPNLIECVTIKSRYIKRQLLYKLKIALIFRTTYFWREGAPNPLKSVTFLSIIVL